MSFGSSEHFQTLMEALKGNKTIAALHVFNWKIKKDEKNLQLLAEYAQRNKSLEQLMLTESGLEIPGVESLITGIGTDSNFKYQCFILSPLSPTFEMLHSLHSKPVAKFTLHGPLGKGFAQVIPDEHVLKKTQCHFRQITFSKNPIVPATVEDPSSAEMPSYTTARSTSTTTTDRPVSPSIEIKGKKSH